MKANHLKGFNLRLLCISSLFLLFALNSCTLFHVVQSESPQITAEQLAIKHHYAVPKKNCNTLTRFHDPQLAQLMRIALEDSPSIHNARARLFKAQQLTKNAYAALWPSVGLNSDVNQQHFTVRGKVPAPFNELNLTKANIADLALNFNYEFDFWGKNREILASRLSETFAAQMDLAQSSLILSASVATTYFELQNMMLQRQLAQKNARLQQELADIVIARAKQGIESDIPVKTAVADQQSALLTIANFKDAEMQSRHKLAVLIGKNPFTTTIKTTQFTYVSKQMRLPAIIPANVLALRPDIAAARGLSEAAAHQINVAKAAFFPNINLAGLLSMQSFYFSRFFNISLQTEGIKAALDLPLFDAGARRANLGVKYNEFEQTINQYNQTILNALQEIADQLSALARYDRQLMDQNNVLRATQTNYKLFRARYKQGIIDYVQLIEIKQLLLQQHGLIYQLQTQRKQAFVALLTALGSEVLS